MPLSRLRHRFPSTEPFIPLLEEIRHTMTEWWLRKAVIRHLFPIFCNYYFIRDGITMSPLTRSVGSVTLAVVLLPDTLSFQLTRSVGSVTCFTFLNTCYFRISTHTLRGERDVDMVLISGGLKISTHTLRGERDTATKTIEKNSENFNSHAPCLLYTSPSPRDRTRSRMPSSA